MKKTEITVRHWTLDNAGSYHKPGSTLTIVADDDENPDASEGCIGAKRADFIAQLNAAHDAQAPAQATPAPDVTNAASIETPASE